MSPIFNQVDYGDADLTEIESHESNYFNELNGGRCWVRTSDPCRVKIIHTGCSR